MKKTTKGTIAIAAAITLLLGGAGSLAYWQESATISAVPIATGQLHVTTQPGTWAVKRNATAAAQQIDPATFKMVPGDIVTYTVPFSTLADGTNLAATATVAWGGAGTLPTGMTSSTGGTYNGAAIPASSTFSVVKGASAVTGQLVFTLTWDFGTAGSTAGMSQSINLANTTVTVKQDAAS